MSKTFKDLEKLEVIPSTIENVSIVLGYLNKQNWGTWKLPMMEIGYKANQYDCEGKIITTMKLDKGITDEEYGIINELFLKVVKKEDT